MSEAIIRSVLDAGGFAIGVIFFASGGWGALMGGVALAAGVELGKILINYAYTNMPALKQEIGLS